MGLSAEWCYETAERGYQLRLERDLLGDLVVTRRWWGRFNGRGGERSEPVADEATALQLIAREQARRHRHGYVLKSHRSVDHDA